MFRTRLGVCLLASALVVDASAQRGAPQAPATGTASIAGRVIDEATGVPAGAIDLELQVRRPGAMTPVLRRTRSDQNGVFMFEAVPAGAFLVNPTSADWLTAESFLGRAQPLADHQRRSDVTVRIVRPGAVEGVVRSAGGKPIPGATVAVFRLLDTQRAFTSFKTAQTDAEGRYRVSGLPPGEYLATVSITASTAPREVMARVRNQGRGTGIASVDDSWGVLPGGRVTTVGDLMFAQVFSATMIPVPSVAAAETPQSFRTTFHPDATSIVLARSIAVPPGGAARDVDIALQASPAAAVRGRLTWSDGRPARHVGVRLVDPGRTPPRVTTDSYVEVATTVTDEAGAFTFLSVPFGRLTLRSFLRAEFVLPSAEAPLPGQGIREFVEHAVDISSATVDVGTLTFRPPIATRGVLMEATPGGTEPERPVRRQVVARPLDDPWPIGVRGGGTDELGRFEIFSVPGRFELGVFRAPGSIRAITRGESPDPLMSIEVSADSPRVRVTLAAQQTRFRAAIAAEGGTGAAGARVILVPADYHRWIAEHCPFGWERRVRADADGVVSIVGLPEGEYLAAALSSEQAFVPELIPMFPDRNWTDVRVVIAVADRASRITLRAGETVSAVLPLLVGPRRGPWLR